jgi:hypothetical protein
VLTIAIALILARRSRRRGDAMTYTTRSIANIE